MSYVMNEPPWDDDDDDWGDDDEDTCPVEHALGLQSVSLWDALLEEVVYRRRSAPAERGGRS